MANDARRQIGNPAENTLLPGTATELGNLDLKLREVMVDGAFTTVLTNAALENLADEVHITGRQGVAPGDGLAMRRRWRPSQGSESPITVLGPRIHDPVRRPCRFAVEVSYGGYRDR